MLQGDLAEQQVAPKLQISGALPNIKIDRIQIEQVLLNLIRNALEAMAATPPAERRLTITAAQVDGEAVIRIADTGPGLPLAIAERLFQPYQTTKPQGMGLGLAVSRAILQAHGGRLWPESTKQKGTTFCLSLPLSVKDP